MAVAVVALALVAVAAAAEEVVAAALLRAVDMSLSATVAVAEARRADSWPQLSHCHAGQVGSMSPDRQRPSKMMRQHLPPLSAMSAAAPPAAQAAAAWARTA